MANELEPVAQSFCDQNGYSFDYPTGEGAFKQTFKISSQAGEDFALKIYKVSLGSERPQREIDAMQRCNHPNIAKVLGVGTHELSNQIYGYLLESYIAGGTLSEKCSIAPIDNYNLKELAVNLINAIAHIEGLSLVHRDIKPDNIMYSGETPILVDFGIVRDLNETSLTRSWAVRGPGTPAYASPEQLNNEKEMIDWRSDQFSLGIVLAEILLGNHPFILPSEQIGDAVVKVSERRPLPEVTVQRLEKSGFGIISRMLDPWPVRRFRTPVQLQAAWADLEREN